MSNSKEIYIQLDWLTTQINWFYNAVKLLDEMMFCLTSQKQINRAIAERDAFEEALFKFRKIRKEKQAIIELNNLV